MQISENVTLQDKNWFKTGGTADYFCEPENQDDFKEALIFAKKNRLEFFLLGEGANLLFSDRGFKGLVIRPAFLNIETENTAPDYALVRAGCGVKMDSLIEFCLANKLTGLEEFSGIPGTIGGSVYINIHYMEFLLSSFLVKAYVLSKEGEVLTVDNSWFNFGYDQSRLHSKDYFLMDASFKLKKTTEAFVSFARGRKSEIIRHRNHRYPSKNSCGSFFRNFSDEEVCFEIGGSKILSVAYYLEKVGVKGSLKVGDAKVSQKHSNMIENLEAATSADIIAVAREMQKKVFSEFGLLPKAECQFAGFESYPILR